MSRIRYLKITLVDGTRFILRVTSESSKFVRGYEVNEEGDEVVPPGYENRHRSVERSSITKAVEMRMNNTYATLEVEPRPAGAKTAAQLNAEIAAALARKNLCAYCGKPTRKGSMLLDEGQTAHRSCYKEFEGG